MPADAHRHGRRTPARTKLRTPVLHKSCRSRLTPVSFAAAAHTSRKSQMGVPTKLLWIRLVRSLDRKKTLESWGISGSGGSCARRASRRVSFPGPPNGMIRASSFFMWSPVRRQLFFPANSNCRQSARRRRAWPRPHSDRSSPRWRRPRPSGISISAGIPLSADFPKKQHISANPTLGFNSDLTGESEAAAFPMPVGLNVRESSLSGMAATVQRDIFPIHCFSPVKMIHSSVDRV